MSTVSVNVRYIVPPVPKYSSFPKPSQSTVSVSLDASDVVRSLRSKLVRGWTFQIIVNGQAKVDGDTIASPGSAVYIAVVNGQAEVKESSAGKPASAITTEAKSASSASKGVAQADAQVDPSGTGDEKKAELSDEKKAELGKKLFDASRGSKTAEVKRLIAMKAPVDWQGRADWASLHIASMFGNTDIVMLLIEGKANLNVPNLVGDTPLILAATANEMTAVRALKEAGADLTIMGDDNKTAAEKAQQKGNNAIVEYLKQ